MNRDIELHGAPSQRYGGYQEPGYGGGMPPDQFNSGHNPKNPNRLLWAGGAAALLIIGLAVKNSHEDTSPDFGLNTTTTIAVPITPAPTSTTAPRIETTAPAPATTVAAVVTTTTVPKHNSLQPGDIAANGFTANGLEEILVQLGCVEGSHERNGIYDPNSVEQTAVETFQRLTGLSVDGFWGAGTSQKAVEALAYKEAYRIADCGLSYGTGQPPAAPAVAPRPNAKAETTTTAKKASPAIASKPATRVDSCQDNTATTLACKSATKAPLASKEMTQK